MEPLIILVVTFTIALMTIKLIKKSWMISLAGRIAMSVMLLFTALSHFVYAEGMILMLPEFIPFKKAVVYFTGFVEIVAANGLMIPRLRKLTGWLLIIFFVLIIPANIHAAIQQVNLRTASYDGNDVNYLWFRIPLQLFFIAWVYLFAIKNVKHI